MRLEEKAALQAAFVQSLDDNVFQQNQNNRYDFLTLTAANGECGTVQLYLCKWQGRGRTMIMCAVWRKEHVGI